MKFLHPEFLYYMIPPLIVLYALLLTQKESQAVFFSPDVMDRLRVVAKTLTLKARNALFFFAGIFMIVALAEPVIVDGKIMVKQKSADILVALDISNSMLATDVYPNRLELSKKKAIYFIKNIKQDRVGVIAFAKASYLVSPLSFDKEAVAFLLKNLDTTSITEQGTDFMGLLETTANSSKKSKQKYLLIFTDGGDKKDFSKEIDFAKEKNITVFIIGVGSKKGSPIKMGDDFLRYKGEIVVTKLNESISSLALDTGGVFIKATNSNKDIDAMVMEMEKIVKKKEIKAKSIEKYIPLFYLPLGTAMLFILIALSSMSKRVKVEVPSAILLAFVMLGFGTELKASLLDFVDIKKAKEYYQKQEYEKAAKIYQKYANSSKNPQGYFDAANAYYKAGKYKKALENYKKISTKDLDLAASTLYNMGNAYVKTKQYKQAISSYEQSLKLKKDIKTKENLEEVKKLLKKQQQKKQQKNNQNKDKNSKNKENNSKKENKKDSNNSKKGKNNQNQDTNSNNHKQKKQNDTQDKQNKKEAKNKQNKQKAKLDKLNEENNKTKKESSQIQKAEDKKDKMSEKEEKKWLRELNKDAKTFMYMINKPKNFKEDEDEKPW